MALFELLDAVARSGVAVLLISHQLNLVARFATRLVVLSHGAIVASGSPDDVMRGDLLERVYGWPILVTRDAAVGAPMLVPMRRRGPA
jgi:iron complex transport system ATP-binding protein